MAFHDVTGSLVLCSGRIAYSQVLTKMPKILLSGRMFYFFISGKTFQLHCFHYLKQAVKIFQMFSPSDTRSTKIIICWMIPERAEMDVTADVLC